MAQHRIMTILLFVCLSLCFEVAQSRLKKDGDPCIYSADCGSRCCHRDSPKGSGKCVQKSSPGVRCYGPNTGEPCFRSHQCNSGCCMPSGSMYNAVCELKHDKTQGCIGPNLGDLCYSSDQCHSGCCHISQYSKFSGMCTENTKKCLGQPTPGLHYYCPCQKGLICEIDRSPNNTVTTELKRLFGKFYKLKIEKYFKTSKTNVCKKPNSK
ncbi:leucine-rich colipase-like protein 1 isoform X4 [Eleutherodactylus coqui]|uniref:leucine-rich colipase-like protein 1 isoform X4 n=1 Tax=Eleutherodactylus coqui TaxID=57060 RepID=UPI0034629D4D